MLEIKNKPKISCFTNKVGYDSRYFVGVNRMIIIVNWMIIANSYPTRTRGIIIGIYNNYSPKWRWLVMDVYRSRVSGEVNIHH